MQQVRKHSSEATSIMVAVGLALLFGIWEAYATYQTDQGFATNRAWIGPVILGYALIIIGSFASLVALFLVTNRKKVFTTLLTLIGIGITPTIVHWLFRPICEFLNIY